MKKNKRGFSLIELAIAVGLITVLIGVVAAGGGMMNKCRLQRETEAVNNLRLASQNYIAAPSLTYAGISITALKAAGLLPNSFDPLKANSFGGDYAVVANSADNTKVDIALANIPSGVSAELTAMFAAKAEAITYDAGSRSWKATF
jgi:prepilin-type N-terminal cleavage/methylation domain-containing protein